MKKFLLLFQLSIIHFQLSIAQTPGQWTWMHGLNTWGSAGSPGTLGIPSPTNEPPAFYEPAEWTDLNGNFWLFSGWNQSNQFNNDLWKYNPVTNEWTWMNGNGLVNDGGSYGTKGVSSPTNLPPSRSFGCLTWTDANNNLWLFGGATSAVNAFNDLWKYNITTNEWTWISGYSVANLAGLYGTQGVGDTSNFPGGRYETDAAWSDNTGNLWLYGGARNNNCLNDLWKYNIASRQWTWMKGDTTGGVAPVYGVQTVEAATNKPGAGIVYSAWKDCSGNLWMFGSGNYYLNQSRNDMWRYSPATNNWTWMNGSNLPLQPGVYGTQCTPATANTPGYRYENRAHCTDANGNFWMLGGGYGGSLQTWNDLWVYSALSNQWMFVKGSVTSNAGTVWGTLGVSAPANVPGGRCANVGWADGNGHLYFFGGTDNTFSYFYNDLFMYTIDTACVNFVCNTTVPVAAFAVDDTMICPGSCINFTNMSTGATSYQWIFNGATPVTSTDINPANICYNTSGSYDVTLIAANAVGTDTIVFTNLVHVYPQPVTPVITQGGNILYATSGYVSYQWYFGSDSIAGAADSFYVATQNGNYNLVVTDTNGCNVGVGIINVVVKGDGIEEFNVQSLKFDVYPNPANDNITVTIFSYPLSIFNLEIYNCIGEKIYRDICRYTTCRVPTTRFSNGIYLVKITSGDNFVTKTIVIEK